MHPSAAAVTSINRKRQASDKGNNTTPGTKTKRAKQDTDTAIHHSQQQQQPAPITVNKAQNKNVIILKADNGMEYTLKKRKRPSAKFTNILKQDILQVRRKQHELKKGKSYGMDEEDCEDELLLPLFQSTLLTESKIDDASLALSRDSIPSTTSGLLHTISAEIAALQQESQNDSSKTGVSTPQAIKSEHSKIDESKSEHSKIEESKIEESKIEESKIEESKIEESKIEESKIPLPLVTPLATVLSLHKEPTSCETPASISISTGKAKGSVNAKTLSAEQKLQKKKETFLLKKIVEASKRVLTLTSKYQYHDRLALLDQIQEWKNALQELQVLKQQEEQNSQDGKNGSDKGNLSEDPRVALKRMEEQILRHPLMNPMSDIIAADICKRCHALLRHKQSPSDLVCPSCGLLTEYSPSTNAGVAFGEDVEISVHAYERVKHFRTNSQQYSLDANPIPAYVPRKVHRVYTRLHVRSIHEVRPTPVKEVLKSLSLTDFRNASTRLTNQMNSQPTALFTQDQIKEVLQMFLEIQTVFIGIIKSSDRRNFLNTNYLWNKFCRIKGWNVRANCFPLMKERKVLEKQDASWKKVCRIKGWKFYRSV